MFAQVSTACNLFELVDNLTSFFFCKFEYFFFNKKNNTKIYITSVDGLIFVAALSSYNAVLYEDGATNGMKEAVRVFYDIIKKK